MATPKNEAKATDLIEDEPEQGGPRPFWSGTLTFGLVSIPVELFSAYKSVRTSLRMLGPDHKPLSRRYFCPKEQKMIESDEIVRGYEIADGEFVLVTDEELESLAPRKSRDIELKRFVDASAVPPLYFEQSYWLAPSGESVRAYHLLATTMDRGKKAGIATFVMRGKEHLVAILSDGGLLRAETLRFADELRTPQQVGLPAVEAPEPKAVKQARQAIHQLSSDRVDHSELKDSYAERLLKLVEEKKAAKAGLVKLKSSTSAEARAEGGDVIDLMEVLKRSLARASNTGDAGAHSKRASSPAPKSLPSSKKPAKRRPKKASARAG
ncbi:MAG TPA: Ku protein [Polyangiaceae bacterium]|nr:Ku protein [Polyangiaceae bacterium]